MILVRRKITCDISVSNWQGCEPSLPEDYFLEVFDVEFNNTADEQRFADEKEVKEYISNPQLYFHVLAKSDEEGTLFKYDCDLALQLDSDVDDYLHDKLQVPDSEWLEIWVENINVEYECFEYLQSLSRNLNTVQPPKLKRSA